MCHSRASGNPDRAGSRIKCGMTKRNVDPQSEALRFRLRMTRGGSFPYLPFVIPVKTGIQIQLDPQSEALCFRLRMTRGVSFPRKRESSRFVWIPDQVGDDKGGFRLRMTKGVSFPLEAKLSKQVIPVKTGIQSAISRSPIRSASLSVEDDKGVE